MALTDEDRERIRELHAEGLSRNGISVVTGFRRDDVSTAAEEMGLKFNSKVTEKATRAIAEQNYERRALLMRMQMDEALTLQRRMFEPVVQGQSGGRDNTWNEVELEEISGVPPQITASPGMPERKAVARRQARVRQILNTLPPAAQRVIRRELDEADRQRAKVAS